MTMTHKEALQFAQDAYYGGLISKWDPKNDKYMEAAIRAYIEARGLVLVPKEAVAYKLTASDGGVFYAAGEPTGAWSSVVPLYSAAPDPFAIDTEDGQ